MFVLPLLFAAAYLAWCATHVDRGGAVLRISAAAVAVVSVLFAGFAETLATVLIGALLGWATGRQGWARVALLCGAGVLTIGYVLVVATLAL